MFAHSGSKHSSGRIAANLLLDPFSSHLWWVKRASVVGAQAADITLVNELLCKTLCHNTC